MIEAIVVGSITAIISAVAVAVVNGQAKKIQKRRDFEIESKQQELERIKESIKDVLESTKEYLLDIDNKFIKIEDSIERMHTATLEQFENQTKTLRTMQRGLTQLLAMRLEEIFAAHSDDDAIPLSVSKQAAALFTNYKALGGNGAIATMYKQFCDKKVISNN